MFKKKIYYKNLDLVPFVQNYTESYKKNSLDKEIIINIKNSIIKIVKSCDVVLLHECSEFENFKGRDVDTFYLSNKKLMKFNEDKEILHQREKGCYRFLINDPSSIKFTNLDVENLFLFFSKNESFNINNFKSSKICNLTGLRHFRLHDLIFYKLVKYFKYGVIHSYEQLYKLKKTIDLIPKDQVDQLLITIEKLLPRENFWIKRLIYEDFNSFERDQEIKNFWIEKRYHRQKKRKVFSGKLKFINLIFDKKFIFSFMFGSLYRWPKIHRPLPAIAIVGNDGSGKSSVIDYIIKNFSKMDPAHITMRPDTPILPIVKSLRIFLKHIYKNQFIRKLKPLKFMIGLFGQSIDLFDRYIKYKVGMAWADCGYGVTIFERYTTDKIRGEFPDKKYFFLPLEQYFPMPDGIIYLDAMPEISLKRKPKDDHTLQEMISKRLNYLSLLNEFDKIKKINCNQSLNEKIKEIKNYIFELAQSKRENLRSGLGIRRCKWKKNRNRVLHGESKLRYQKDSFL